MKHYAYVKTLALFLVLIQTSLAQSTPQVLEDAGLTRILDDRTLFQTAEDNLNNWEPYVSVIGEDVFVIEANTFADDGTSSNQRYGLAFQSVSGGDPVLGDVFFDDNGNPFRGAINKSRQDGNPGRVAGDKRPRAQNFIAGGEGSLHTLGEFGVSPRWDIGFGRTADARFAAFQLHSYNQTTLEQRPIGIAIDAVNAQVTEGQAPDPQITRFGGELAVLDNGNFLAVVEDRSQVRTPADRAVTGTIISPDLEFVNDGFLITEGEIWSNVAAHQGGFCVRVGGVLHFLDNTGAPQGDPVNQDTSSVGFDSDRGDNTRLAAHINSPYVFLAGVVDGVVQIAAWDARDRSFAGSTNVSELDLDAVLERVNLAVDALNRVAVVYEATPGTPAFANAQVVVRVLAFDDTNNTFNYLTPTVYAFKNVGESAIRSVSPSVAITTNAILVAAKGEINSANDPSLGVDTPVLTTFYTILQHPDPQEDPTAPFGAYVPPTAAKAGIERIVDDRVLFLTENDNLNNWEPYTSVIGEDVFLIEANTFAEGDDANQRYRVAFQPVVGGDVVEGEAFFGDDGQPHTGPINKSRQNGNPGRVAGDKRPGALNFMTGGEASPHLFDPFTSDDRWDLGYDRLADGRYGTVQLFSIDPNILQQTSVSTSLDAAGGRLTSGVAPDPQISRFGGDLAGLDNGNFVAVVEDRSNANGVEGTAAVGAIFGPDGSLVKDSFVISEGAIWSNVAAFQGGFAVRVNGLLHFFNNAGEQQGEPVDQLTSDIAFDAGRGDGTRIAAHINSPYVFLSGVVDGVIQIAVWDARDRSFVTAANVSELKTEDGGADSLTYAAEFGRTSLAVDALNRVAVAFAATMGEAEFSTPQIVMRVLAFDADSNAFSFLTKSFLVFQNVAIPGVADDIRTLNPSVSMTTKAILIAAKGEVNQANDPSQGADTPAQTTIYTVIQHPDPQNDPTSRVGGGVGELGTLTIGNTADGSVNVSWSGAGTLQESIDLREWKDTDGAANPLNVQPQQEGNFYRLTR